MGWGEAERKGSEWVIYNGGGKATCSWQNPYPEHYEQYKSQLQIIADHSFTTITYCGIMIVRSQAQLYSDIMLWNHDSRGPAPPYSDNILRHYERSKPTTALQQ